MGGVLLYKAKEVMTYIVACNILACELKRGRGVIAAVGLNARGDIHASDTVLEIIGHVCCQYSIEREPQDHLTKLQGPSFNDTRAGDDSKTTTIDKQVPRKEVQIMYFARNRGQIPACTDKVYA